MCVHLKPKSNVGAGGCLENELPRSNRLQQCRSSASLCAYLLLPPHPTFSRSLIISPPSPCCTHADAGADEFDDAIEAALRAAAGTTEATPAVPGGYIDGETLQEANELRQEQEQAAAAAAADANYEAAATSGGDNDAAYVVPETAKESGAYVDGETLQAAGEVAAGELPTAGKAFSM